jgi:hypothetical protein
LSLTAKKSTAVSVIGGKVDIDADGWIDADDDGMVILNWTAYNVINWLVDVDGDGAIENNGNDDIATAFNLDWNTTTKVKNWYIDVDGDGNTAENNGEDDLSAKRYFIWTDKANPNHSDTTADWANGYGLNMDVLTNNAFSDQQ